MSEDVAILGASTNPERYSFKAMQALLHHGHNIYLISPKYEIIEGNKVYKSLDDIPEKVTTLTLYVGEKISSTMEQTIIDLAPKRVIFNPGSENQHLNTQLKRNGIEALEACTLVMLATDQF